MKKVRNLAIGGIQAKIVSLIAVAAILTAAGFLSVILYQNRMLLDLTQETAAKQNETMSQISGSMVDDLIAVGMDRTTQLQANNCDDLFSRMKMRVEMMGEYAYTLFADPDNAPRAEYSPPDPEDDGRTCAQLLLSNGADISSPELAHKMGVAANMSDLMIILYESAYAVNSCFIALPEGGVLMVDDRPAAKYTRDGALIRFDVHTRPWYKLAEEKGELIFTDVEIDRFTSDIGVVCAMPVYVDGELVAIVGSDMFLNSMKEEISASNENGGFMFIVNEQGHVVFSPRTEGPLRMMHPSTAIDLRAYRDRDLAGLVADALVSKTDVRHVMGYYMIGAPMKTAGWAVISAFSEAEAAKPGKQLRASSDRIQEEAAESYRAQEQKLERFVFAGIAAVVLVMGTIAVLVGRRIAGPLNSITRRISSLRGGEMEFKMEDAYRTGDEIEVLAESFSELSHKTAVYVDEVRRVTAEQERMGTELQMATQIQESMLPGKFPAFPDRDEFEIYASMRPAKEVGGDFYDFFLIDEDRLGLVMADVSGKSVPAALFMMASKIILQSNARHVKSPAKILQKTNEVLCANNRMEMFVTVWLGILEISTGKITAANAGHEYPAVQRNGKYELLRDKHGFVLGGLEDAAYTEYELQLNRGDRLFLYTDGVPEATDGDGAMFGTDRMLEALNKDPSAPPEQTLDAVREAVNGFVKDAEQFDDMTMMCLKYRGPQDA